MARHLDRSAEAWRREQPLVSVTPEALTDGAPLVGRQIRVDVLLGEGLTGKRRGPCGDWLRGRGVLARHVGLRHGPLFNRPDRLAGHAIEHEQESLLCGLRHHVAAASVLANRQELRRHGQVVVPHVVMNDLVVP
jgi:hypothetical protein